MVVILVFLMFSAFIIFELIKERMAGRTEREKSGVIHKKIDETLVATIRFIGEYEEVGSRFETLYRECKECVCGPSILAYCYGTGAKDMEKEVCCPVTQAVETDEVKSKVLEGIEAVSTLHYGPYQNLGESYKKLRGFINEHGLTTELTAREVYLEKDDENPGKNITEIQIPLHKWDDLFAENVTRVLGDDARREIMKGSDKITTQSTVDERFKWLKAALERLDKIADEEQKFEILSRCSHLFPRECIENLRAVYAQNRDIDEVLKVMRENQNWYNNLMREDNIIYLEKSPFNRKGYYEATSEAEKKIHYCHCPMVKKHLDEIPSAFCYCGAGWYRQQWEGILGPAVKIEILKSLTKGDDVCQFAVHLPS